MFKLSQLVSLSAALAILNGAAYADKMQECIDEKTADMDLEAVTNLAADPLNMAKNLGCCEGELASDPTCNLDEALAGLGEGLGELLDGAGEQLDALGGITDCLDIENDGRLKDGCDCNDIIPLLQGFDPELGAALAGCCMEGTTAADFNACAATKQEMMDAADGATPTTLPADEDPADVATPTTLPADEDPADGADPTTLPAEDPVEAQSADSAGNGAFLSALTSIGIMSVAAFNLV